MIGDISSISRLLFNQARATQIRMMLRRQNDEKRYRFIPFFNFTNKGNVF